MRFVSNFASLAMMGFSLLIVSQAFAASTASYAFNQDGSSSSKRCKSVTLVLDEDANQVSGTGDAPASEGSLACKVKFSGYFSSGNKIVVNALSVNSTSLLNIPCTYAGILQLNGDVISGNLTTIAIGNNAAFLSYCGTISIHGKKTE